MKVKVRCSYVLDVEISDTLDPFFHIEENSCPGTGAVGSELDRIRAAQDAKSCCWACAVGGENKILEINGEKVKSSNHQ